MLISRDGPEAACKAVPVWACGSIPPLPTSYKGDVMDILKFIKDFNKKSKKPLTPQEVKLSESLMNKHLVIKRYDKRVVNKKRV